MTRLESLRALYDAVKGESDQDGIYTFATPDQARWCVAAYHGSLDAALALHNAVLPGWEWRLRGNRAWVWRTPSDLQESGEVEGDDFNGLPARAMLLAILSALIAQGEAP